MFKYSKLTLKIFINSTLIIIFHIITSIYLADPLQVFHKSFFNPNRHGEARESLKSIIRDNSFDGIIVGSSLSENFSAKEVSAKMGGKYINISVSAAVPKENATFIKYSIKEKNIKNVLYVFNTAEQFIREEPQGTRADKYDFIYSDNILQVARIYGISKYLYCAITYNQSEYCTGPERDMDKPYAWDSQDKHMNRFGGYENWIKNTKNNQIKHCFDEINLYNRKIDLVLENDYENKIEKHFQKYIIDTAKENPLVHFNIIIAPVSNLYLSMITRVNDKKYGHLEHFIASQKALIKLAQDYPNITIYGFQNDKDLNEVKNFKDFTHYHPDVNVYILDKIAKQQNILNVDNMNEYFKNIRNTAYSYNYDYYRNKIVKK